MSSSISAINARINSNTFNNSRIDATAPFKGDVIWSDTILVDQELLAPQHLAIIDNTLFIRFQVPAVTALDRRDGKKLWSKSWLFSNSFMIIDRKVVVIEQGGEYTLIKQDQTVADKKRLPMFLNSSLTFLDIRDNEMLYTLNHQPQPPSEPGTPGRDPYYSVIHFDNKRDEFLLVYEQKGSLQQILFSPVNNRYFMLADWQLSSFLFGARSASDVKVLDFGKVLQVSLTDDGKLLTVTEEKKGRLLSLRVITQKDPLWTYPLPSDFCTQPPSAYSDGTVYLVCGNDLTRIENGAQKWSVTLPCANGEALYSVLKDGSVLVAAGYNLLLVDPDGQIVTSKFIEIPLSCRPIADETGTVYAAGKGRIFCIR